MAGVRTPASLHDVELAALAAAGDRPAFGELVRRHGSAVRGLLRRMGAEPSLADDIAQDAFLAAFERVSEFRGEGTFSAWVRKIAARLYVAAGARSRASIWRPRILRTVTVGRFPQPPASIWTRR